MLNTVLYLISFPIVFWFSLLCKCFKSFFSVLGMHYPLIVKSLYLQTCPQIYINSPVNRSFCMFDAKRSVWQHLLYKANCFFLCSLEILFTIVYNPQLFSFVTIQFPSSKNQLFGFSYAYCTGQCLSSSCAWDQAPISLRQTNQRFFSSNSNICVQCKLKSSTKSRAINNTQDRTMNISNIIKNSSQIPYYVFYILGRFIKSFLQISTCAKIAFLTASQNNSSKVMLLIDIFNSQIQLIEQCNRQCIFFLGISQLQFCN